MKQSLNRAIYLALGVNLEGRKEILGMWSSPTGCPILVKCLNSSKTVGYRMYSFAVLTG